MFRLSLPVSALAGFFHGRPEPKADIDTLAAPASAVGDADGVVAGGDGDCDDGGAVDELGDDDVGDDGDDGDDGGGADDGRCDGGCDGADGRAGNRCGILDARSDSGDGGDAPAIRQRPPMAITSSAMTSTVGMP